MFTWLLLHTISLALVPLHLQAKLSSLLHAIKSNLIDIADMFVCIWVP